MRFHFDLTSEVHASIYVWFYSLVISLEGVRSRTETNSSVDTNVACMLPRLGAPEYIIKFLRNFHITCEVILGIFTIRERHEMNKKSKVASTQYYIHLSATSTCRNCLFPMKPFETMRCNRFSWDSFKSTNELSLKHLKLLFRIRTNAIIISLCSNTLNLSHTDQNKFQLFE